MKVDRSYENTCPSKKAVRKLSFLWYANGSDVNNQAAELYIDHQKALLLPMNIGQRLS